MNFELITVIMYCNDKYCIELMISFCACSVSFFNTCGLAMRAHKYEYSVKNDSISVKLQSTQMTVETLGKCLMLFRPQFFLVGENGTVATPDEDGTTVISMAPLNHLI